MLELFWELRQQFQIDQLRTDATRGKHADRRAGNDIEALERRIDALTLATVAMWSFVEEKLGVTEDDLRERVREIDLRDGARDGRITPAPVQCRGCGRQLSKRHRSCMYCGEPNLERGPFPEG